MHSSRTLIFAVSASFAGVLWLAVNPAHADGISSKEKARSAQTSVVTATPTRSITTAVSEQEKIGLIVRRTARGNERRNRKAALEAMQSGEATANSNPAQRVDRLRLIRRGQKSAPMMQCRNLHTHLRSVCQRNAQLLQNTERVQLALRNR